MTIKKQKRKLIELKNWDKNPKSVMKEDFRRLQWQLLTLGIYKDFIIADDGEVLGGNSRLKACNKLAEELAASSIDKVAKKYDVDKKKVERFAMQIAEGVPVTNVGKVSEKEKLEYALSDNDRVGMYEAEQLAELVMEQPELQLEEFMVDLGEPYSLDQIVAMASSELDLGYSLNPEGNSSGTRTLKYEIIFEDQNQKNEFYDALNEQQGKNEELSIAEIITKCLKAQ